MNNPSIASSSQEKPKRKKGIIYLSNIPLKMNVINCRRILSGYGDIGRIYFQRVEKDNPKKSKKIPKHYTEGWVEFERKKIAKQIAPMLNNKRIEYSKKGKFYDNLWNMKYLPRFKWEHLSERLVYEKTIRKYKVRSEVIQAKREANFISNKLEKSAKSKRKDKTEDPDPKIRQKETFDKEEPTDEAQNRNTFFTDLFDSD